MHAAYTAVLWACTLAVLALVLWRLAHLWTRPQPSPARLINEWVWTLVPVLILVGLLWRVLA